MRPALSAPARRAFQAVITATAVLAALALFVAACATGGTGARDEGPAGTDAVAGKLRPNPSSMASAYATPHDVDAVRLVLDDPGVAPSVKRALKPCVGDEYPVDVSYGDLTGGADDDVVVNVMTCSDAVGVGSYVYREAGDAYRNVFRAEESPVYAEIDRGDLVVTKQVYKKDDPVTSPSGENVITYQWTAGRFILEYRIHNDYSSAVDGDAPTTAPN
ncbi:lipoprotein CseA [Streptomyces sp. NRRL WC-3618]|uniref:hypothetical protein n=1 Tax=Streptomyces sp. NRRL WC-3618 TaxID=1519490 RepID=UPI0006AF2FFB|nr:hypothetical protein [Streptomyces sp. NRRL WC-3618]KOV75957.1 lipoprotein CseA [Streptomyces sp. NRRL WC-3618]